MAAEEEELVGEAGSEAASSDLERVNTAVAHLVSALEGEEAGLGSSLSTVREVAGRPAGRDSALALEAAKVLVSRCQGRTLSRATVSVLAALLPLLGEEECQEPGLWLSLLCAVSPLLPPGHPFLGTRHFWDLVQAGLAHTEPLPRKRGLYLLRLACAAPGPAPGLLCPASLQLPALLHSYFLLLETLEEKQPHLVRQLLPRLEELVLVSGGEPAPPTAPLHVSWVVVAYRRLWLHPSTALARWGLESFLTRPWPGASTGCPAFQALLSGPLLEVLNQTRLYGAEGEAEGSLRPVEHREAEGAPLGRVIAAALATFLSRVLTGPEAVQRLVAAVACR